LPANAAAYVKATVESRETSKRPGYTGAASGLATGKTVIGGSS
jgi:hypothetical protein